MNKWAIVTGASAGIGWEIAKLLDTKGYSLVLVARREERLLALQKELKNPSECFVSDLGNLENCHKLHSFVADKDVEVLVNNAGFGSINHFLADSLENDLAMISLNVLALQTLTKLFLTDFVAKDRGYLLNVASLAGLCPAGPYMSTYYATKAYVTSFTAGLAKELKDSGSKVYIGSLNPGPVHTEFGAVARGGKKPESSSSIGTISSSLCAKIAVERMFIKKTLIIPSFMMKLLYFLNKLAPRKLAIELVSKVQLAKTKQR